MIEEKDAIKYVKELGVLKFKLLVDNTLYYETINPVNYNGELVNVEVQFYIKDNGSPTVFKHHSFEDKIDFQDLQIAEINHIELRRNSKEFYFSQYKH